MNTDFVMKLFSAVTSLLNIYSFIIFFRIMFSWIPPRTVYNQYGQPVNEERPLYNILCKITDPFLNLFRSKKLTVGRLDFSTLVALMVLNMLTSISSVIATYGKITLGIILGVLVNGIWSYVIKFFLIILIVMLGIRWIIGRNPYGRGYAYRQVLDGILASPVNFVFKLFYSKGNVREQKLIATAFFFFLCVFLVLRYAFGYLVPLLYSI